MKTVCSSMTVFDDFAKSFLVWSISNFVCLKVLGIKGPRNFDYAKMILRNSSAHRTLTQMLVSLWRWLLHDVDGRMILTGSFCWRLFLGLHLGFKFEHRAVRLSNFGEERSKTTLYLFMLKFIIHYARTICMLYIKQVTLQYCMLFR